MPGNHLRRRVATRLVSASRSETTATAVAGPPAPAPLNALSPPYTVDAHDVVRAVVAAETDCRYQRRPNERVEPVVGRLHLRELPDGAPSRRAYRKSALEIGRIERLRDRVTVENRRNAMPASTTSFAAAS